MSHSPTEAATVRESFDTQNEFEENIRRLNAMVADGFSWSGHEKNCVFLNTHDGQFATISAISGIDFEDDGRAHALVDWDNDGDLDVWSTNRLAPQVRFLRNDCPDDNHFVGLRLEGNGTTTNRDAIGARVEVYLGDGAANQRRIKSLRAGEGFLGQSSKMLNFGLGDDTQISRVVVHWPGGESEAFSGVAADGFYTLKQGRGRAQVWQPPQREVDLTPGPPELPFEGGPSSVVLWSRFPMPVLDYLTGFDPESVRTAPISSLYGTPLLINLWSPDCPPCLQELNEFSQRSAELEAANLNILALTTSGVGSDTSTPQESKAILLQFDFPFEKGRVSPYLLDRLQEAHDVPFTMNLPMAQPTSFLVDAKGQLAAIYRGRVEVDQLLADLRLLALEDGDELLRQKGAFRGTWYRMPGTGSAFNMAAMILAHGRAAEADHYVQTHLEQVRSQSPNQFAELLARIAILYQVNGELEQASLRLQQAIEADPSNGHLYTLLGSVTQQLRQSDAAMQYFRRGYELSPDQPEVLTGLGLALVMRRQTEEGLALLNKAVELGPRNVEARKQLIVVLERLGKAEETIPHRRALLRFSDASLNQHQDAIYELFMRHRFAETLEELELARQRFPDDPQAVSDFVWFLAAAPDDSMRDGSRAVTLAEHAVEVSEGEDYHSLDALAAAQAEVGQFDAAVKTAQQAAEVARQAGDPGMAEDIAKRAAQYRQRQPFRLPDPEQLVQLNEQQKLEEAIEVHRKLLLLVNPPLESYLQLAGQLFALNRPEDGLAELRRTVYRYPQNPLALNNLAWYLSTTPHDNLRNGEEAVELAQRTINIVGDRNPEVVDTMAVAQAESGDFARAVEIGEIALDLARESGNTEMAAQISRRLEGFRQGKPFREE